MGLARFAGNAAKTVGSAAWRAGKQYVRSSVHDFLSGGRGEDDAIARGNKSAIMARENREAAYEDQIAYENAQYQEEHFAPLDSGDEFLDEVYVKLGEIDNKMGKMLAHFVAKDKREEKREREAKHSSLSRKFEKSEKEETPGWEGNVPTAPPSPPQNKNQEGGRDYSVADAFLEGGVSAASDMIAHKALNKVKGRVVTPKNMGRLGKLKTFGKNATPWLAGGMWALEAGTDIYNMATAKDRMAEQYAGYDFSFFQGQQRRLDDGTVIDLGDLVNQNNMAVNEALSAQYGKNLLDMFTAGGFSLGLSIMGVDWDWTVQKSKWEKLGLTEADYNRTKLLLEGGPEAVVANLMNSGVMDQKELQKGLDRAIQGAYLFHPTGAVSLPMSWPVAWGPGAAELMEKSQGMGQLLPKMHQASISVMNQVMAEAEEQFGGPITLEQANDKSFMKEREKKKNEYIERNKLRVSRGRLREGKNGEMADLVWEISNGSKYKSILEKFGFRQLTKAPDERWILNDGSSYYNELIKNGLYQDTPYGRRTIVEKGKEPTFLANGGILNGPTSLGAFEAESISTLEKSGDAIKKTIMDGLAENGNDDWFDSAAMDYLMNSVLPGLVGALKKDEKQLGVATNVSVFG